MTYLLDTAPLLWAVAEPARLSRTARRVMENPRHTLAVSAASLWEVVVKAQTGLLPIVHPAAWLEEALRALGAEVLPIRAAHVYHLVELPILHQDPFDRILVAQSCVENWPLITSDVTIQRYPAPTVW